MFVRAVKTGYYNNILYNAGDEFEIGSKQELGSWMVPIDAPTKPIKQADGPKLEIDKLKQQVAKLTERVDELTADNDTLATELSGTRDDLELERQRLAVIGAAIALGEKPDCSPELETKELQDLLPLLKKKRGKAAEPSDPPEPQPDPAGQPQAAQ